MVIIKEIYKRRQPSCKEKFKNLEKERDYFKQKCQKEKEENDKKEYEIARAYVREFRLKQVIADLKAQISKVTGEQIKLKENFQKTEDKLTAISVFTTAAILKQEVRQ